MAMKPAPSAPVYVTGHTVVLAPQGDADTMKNLQNVALNESGALTNSGKALNLTTADGSSVIINPA
jgi:hypothetical protein